MLYVFFIYLIIPKQCHFIHLLSDQLERLYSVVYASVNELTYYLKPILNEFNEQS